MHVGEQHPNEVLIEVGDFIDESVAVWSTGSSATSLESSVSSIEAQRLRVGQAAKVEDPEHGAVIGARIAAIGESDSAEHESAVEDGLVAVSLEVVGVPSDGLGSDRSYRVTIAGASSAGEVLAVPISAITDGRESETAVTVVGEAGSGDSEGGSQTLVDVVVGISSGGWIEVEAVGDGTLEAGHLVVVGIVPETRPDDE